MRKPVLAADGVAETTFKQQSSFFVKYAKKTVGVCKMPSAKWEVARIGFYISIPVIATYIYAQPDCINFIINRWKYIQYPPQAVSREEYYKKMREIANEDE